MRGGPGRFSRLSEPLATHDPTSFHRPARRDAVHRRPRQPQPPGRQPRELHGRRQRLPRQARPPLPGQVRLADLRDRRGQGRPQRRFAATAGAREARHRDGQGHAGGRPRPGQEAGRACTPVPVDGRRPEVLPAHSGSDRDRDDARHAPGRFLRGHAHARQGGGLGEAGAAQRRDHDLGALHLQDRSGAVREEPGFPARLPDGAARDRGPGHAAVA